MVKILLLISTLINIMPQPNIALLPDKEHMKVEFDYGAVYACTVFQEQKLIKPDNNFPDGHYTSRHCWFVSPEIGSYDEDWWGVDKTGGEWHVWAEIQYPVKDKTDEFVTKTTNILEIVR